MINTGNIISNGTETFTPIINRVLEITGELIPYLIYIAIGALGVSLLWTAIKYILGYLKTKSEGAVQGGRETPEEMKTRLEDEERNRQNPYYNKKRDKPSKGPKFGERGYNSRR